MPKRSAVEEEEEVVVEEVKVENGVEGDVDVLEDSQLSKYSNGSSAATTRKKLKESTEENKKEGWSDGLHTKK